MRFLDVFEDLELFVDLDVFEVLLDLPDLPDFVDLDVLEDLSFGNVDTVVVLL